MMKVKELREKLKKFDDNEVVIFYHLKDNNIECVELESVIETKLGVEFTTTNEIWSETEEMNNEKI